MPSRVGSAREHGRTERGLWREGRFYHKIRREGGKERGIGFVGRGRVRRKSILSLPRRVRPRAPCTWIKVQEQRHPETPRGKQVQGQRVTGQPTGRVVSAETQYPEKGFRTPIYLPERNSELGRERVPLGKAREWAHLAEGHRAGAGPCSQMPRDGVIDCQPPVCRRSPSSGPGSTPVLDRPELFSQVVPGPSLQAAHP